MNKVFVKFICISIVMFSCNPNGNFVIMNNYEVVHNESSKVLVKEIKLDTIVSTKSYYHNGYKLDSLVYKEKICTISKELRIEHKYANTELRSLLDYKDTLFINNSSFCIQDLLKKDAGYFPCIFKIYTFNNSERKFLLATIINSQDRVPIISANVIFDITDYSNIIWIGNSFNNLSSFPMYVGDFNDDGNIEVCRYDKDTIKVLSIHQYDMETVDDRFLVLRRTEDEYCFKIAVADSKWYYSIRNPKVLRSCKFEFLIPDPIQLYVFL